MENIFVEFLPPWVETGLQPAFYDKESGTVLQQTARMYARVNMLIRMFNKLSKNTKEEIERFEGVVNDEIEQFEHDVNETVDEYIEKFTQLKDFVDDYFENLDVQEEINNKLDAMADAGTLQTIIYQYLNSVALFTYDTVASMKLATSFVNGSYAKTLGFYSRTDKGGAVYKIRTKTIADTADEMTLIDLYDNTLIAELVKTEVMNVKQFGAKGDGTSDDTTALQTAFNNCLNIQVPAGTYMVDGITHISPVSGNKISLDSDAIIKCIANDATGYAVISINNVNNVEITGGTISGDRNEHTGSTGEWGMCISVNGTSNNILIHDINLIDAWGDGLYVETTGKVETKNVYVSEARRNGYSLIKCGSFISNDDYIYYTHGTAPQCGIDVEPNNASDALKNIIINNLKTERNSAAGFNTELVTQNDTPTSIILNNFHSYNESRGLRLKSGTNHTGSIEINSPVLDSNTSNQPFQIRIGSVNFKYRINKPYITNYAGTAATHYPIYIEALTVLIPVGNIIITNPSVVNPAQSGSNRAALGAYSSESGMQLSNIKVIDPLDLGGKYIRLIGGTDLLVTDKYEVMKYDDDANFTMGADNMWYLVTSDTFTADRTITLNNTGFYKGCTFKFINTGDYVMNVYFKSQYAYPLTTSSGKTVSLNDKGSSITIRRIDADKWAVISQSGNVTHN